MVFWPGSVSVLLLNLHDCKVLLHSKDICRLLLQSERLEIKAICSEVVYNRANIFFWGSRDL